MAESPSGDMLDIQVEQGPGYSVVRLAGSATMDVAGELRERLIELISASSPRLVLDLSGLEFISSVGLGGIIAAYLRCRRHDGAVQIVAPQPAIVDLLAVTKLDKLFSIHHSLETAITSA